MVFFVSSGALRSRVALLVVALLMFGASRAAGQTGEQRKNVSVSVLLGADSVTVGQFNHEDSTSGSFGTRRLLAHSVNEVYRRPLSAGVEVGYAYRPAAEVVARVTFTSARNKGALVFGELIDRSTSFRTTSRAGFSDYRGWTFEGGHRWRLRNGERVSPYLGGLVGVAVIEPISTDAGFPFAGPGSAFYGQTVTPTASASIGVMVRATRAAAIGVESGLRYQDKLNPDLTDLRSGPWITEETFSGRRLSLPVTGVLRFDF